MNGCEHVGNQASEQRETMSSRKNRQLYKKGDINLGSSMGDIDTVIIRRKKNKCEYQASGMGGDKNVRKSNGHFHLSCVRKSKDNVQNDKLLKTHDI